MQTSPLRQIEGYAHPGLTLYPITVIILNKD